jgi:hypothetical protein
MGLIQRKNISLMTKSNLTASTCVFGNIAGDAGEGKTEQGEEEQIDLAKSRAFLSSARVAPALLLPLSPLADRIRPRLTESVRVEPQNPRRPWGVVGSDPDSLNSFLRSFQ